MLRRHLEFCSASTNLKLENYALKRNSHLERSEPVRIASSKMEKLA